MSCLISSNTILSQVHVYLETAGLLFILLQHIFLQQLIIGPCTM